MAKGKTVKSKKTVKAQKSSKSPSRKKKVTPKENLWAKNVAAKLKALEGQSEKAIKTVYAKIRSTKRSADKRKNQSSAVFMTSYVK